MGAAPSRRGFCPSVQAGERHDCRVTRQPQPADKRARTQPAVTRATCAPGTYGRAGPCEQRHGHVPWLCESKRVCERGQPSVAGSVRGGGKQKRKPRVPSIQAAAWLCVPDRRPSAKRRDVRGVQGGAGRRPRTLKTDPPCALSTAPGPGTIPCPPLLPHGEGPARELRPLNRLLPEAHEDLCWVTPATTNLRGFPRTSDRQGRQLPCFTT